MINVTKAFLPSLQEYNKYIEGIWERVHLTNHGPLVNELEEKLKNYFGVKHFFFINNGTIALQVAIKALNLTGEVITTPFSYVATTSSISWENLKPVFVDIDPGNFTIDAGKLRRLLPRLLQPYWPLTFMVFRVMWMLLKKSRLSMGSK